MRMRGMDFERVSLRPYRLPKEPTKIFLIAKRDQPAAAKTSPTAGETGDERQDENHEGENREASSFPRCGWRVSSRDLRLSGCDPPS
jgi:hypothetical protein